MIIGIGIDVIEISRIGAAIEQESFVKRVFTADEAKYCRSRGVQQAASFAARFAAKEAVAKALGSGFAAGKIKDIEVVTTPGGKPSIVLHGSFARLAGRLGVTNIHISLAHAQEYAVAQVVLEGGLKSEGSNSK
ncbi:Holo-[acyl-carrier-protein] synthase [Sporomusa carbonis]|uniref:holo-ACP synthase n=1 Tax=Sporomusa carbonis TaxID=3076075 RepID=UPI003A77F582